MKTNTVIKNLTTTILEKNSLINSCSVIFLPLIFLLSVLFISFCDISQLFSWIGSKQNEFFISYLIAFGIVNLFYFLNKKAYISTFIVLLSVFSVASYVSRVKYIYRGQPLMPSDLILIKEGFQIGQSYVHINLVILAIAIILVFGAIILALKFYPQDKGFKWSRIYLPAASALIIISITFNFPIPLSKSFNIQEVGWDQGINYQNNGFLIGFDSNIKWLNVEKPKGYSKQKIDGIVKDTNASENTAANMASQKPDIIVIQSEAFWDITKLPNINISEDPLPYFHSLQKEYTSGDLIVPVFGGGTTNTEFQTLTGMTEHFLPQGVMVYNQYLKEPVESIVTALKADGYGATGVHSYSNWFYRRNEVYKNLGFDNFVSAEFFKQPEAGTYIKDQQLADKILEVIHQGNAPKFVFAVSMENHGPYPTTGKYVSKVKADGNISKESLEMVERYSDNLKDVDKSLKYLIDELQKEKRPAIVVLYGDHLPFLGNDYKVYLETKYYSGNMDARNYEKMFSTPFVIWNNIGLKKETFKMSANFLMPYILQKANLNGNEISNYDNQLYGNGIRVIPDEAFDSNFGVNEKEFADLNQLQYDIMFGKGYQYEGNAPKSSADYFMGLGKIEVDSASLDASGAKTISVDGKYLTQTSTVMLNGEALKTTYKDDNQLSAELPDNYNLSKNPEDINVVVKDSYEHIIAESNTIQLKTEK